ncbi:MAG: redoxin domain-containing protein, partial [Armatimonadota bacterium]
MRMLAKSIALPALALLLVAAGCVAQPAPPAGLKPGDKAPDFNLKGSDRKDYDLAQFKGVKAIALCWFPRAGSGGATTQCAALQAAMAQVPADRVQVFGCSTAALDVTTSFAQTGQYSFPVLSDSARAAAQAYGCLRPDGSSERWTYLIDDQGIILAINKGVTPQTQGTELAKMLSAAGLVDGGAAPQAAATGDQQITVDVGGLKRTCLLHLPPAYDGTRQLPVVIALHGARGNGKGMAGM